MNTAARFAGFGLAPITIRGVGAAVGDVNGAPLAVAGVEIGRLVRS